MQNFKEHIKKQTSHKNSLLKNLAIEETKQIAVKKSPVVKK
jgi:hypothetical protein